jgi:NAD-dependent dihydropyrimidine dehydrogenase PreA subunit
LADRKIRLGEGDSGNSAMSKLRYLSGANSLRLDQEKCLGCGMCAVVCPHRVFRIESGKARIVDQDACMECGACALNCTRKAIFVQTGAGCVTAIIIGAIKGTEPNCDCAGGPSCCG